MNNSVERIIQKSTYNLRYQIRHHIESDIKDVVWEYIEKDESHIPSYEYLVSSLREFVKLVHRRKDCGTS